MVRGKKKERSVSLNSRNSLIFNFNGGECLRQIWLPEYMIVRDSHRYYNIRIEVLENGFGLWGFGIE